MFNFKFIGFEEVDGYFVIVGDCMNGVQFFGYGFQCIKNKLVKFLMLIIIVDGDVVYLCFFCGVKVNMIVSYDIFIVVDNYVVFIDLFIFVFF